MCEFFSFLSNGDGKYYYLNWEQRKQTKANTEPDSHSEIVSFYKKLGVKLDLDELNKFEFNPLTKKFTIDQINNKFDDSVFAKQWVQALDFKKIIASLIVKPIINPLLIKCKNSVTKKDIENLKQWSSIENSIWYSIENSIRKSIRDSIWYSIENSIRKSIRDSIGNSIGNSIWNSTGNSIWSSIRNSIWNSTGNSSWNSIRNSIRDSIWYSIKKSIESFIGVYTSSFFDIQYTHDFSCINNLWNRGFIPSFDGVTWRLHQGENAKIVFEISNKNIKND